jgi:hypothetical protein
MRRIARATATFVAFSALLRVIGMVLSRAYEGERTTSADDFKLLALLGGRQLACEATSLRTGTAVAIVGGIDMDLRQATLDPGGAHISLKAIMGGVRMIVPPTWRVYIDEDARAGGIEIETPDPATLDDSAPSLTVEAVAISGGILIETEG